MLGEGSAHALGNGDDVRKRLAAEMRGGEAVVPRYFGYKLGVPLSSEFESDKIPLSLYPARPQRTLRREGDFRKAKLWVRQKEVFELANGGRADGFILFQGG